MTGQTVFALSGPVERSGFFLIILQGVFWRKSYDGTLKSHLKKSVPVFERNPCQFLNIHSDAEALRGIMQTCCVQVVGTTFLVPNSI